MSEIEEFNEMTDLYLELLRKAQEVEDKKLIELVRKRLRHTKKAPFFTVGGCEIITFPRTIGTFLPPIKTTSFWPKVEFAQMAVFITCYLLFILGHYLYS
jgi:hypothetical protein